MDLLTLTRALQHVTVEDLRAIAADLADMVRSPADEVSATKAALEIEHAVRAAQHQAQAGLAAHSVSQAVLSRARRLRIALPDDDVTRVARAAGQLARGLVAGSAVAPAVRDLQVGFRRLPDVPIAAA